MRKNLLYSAVLFSATLISVTILGQYDRYAYTITDVQQDGGGWNTLRKLNLKTGEYSDALLNGFDRQIKAFDATTKRPVDKPIDSRYGNVVQSPFGNGVAAMAYDRRHNRIYYTPMFIDQLRYIDLKTMNVYYVTDQSFSGIGNNPISEGNIITRMVITQDGTGYAISNDGNTFVSFTTGKKTEITQLGSLVDDPSNGTVSIHNRCSSWGGDAVADDKGGIYIVSSRNSIYKLDLETKAAKLLGYINGLPAGFTSNGAVVTQEGNILVSSAVKGDSWYEVQPYTWTAKAYPTPAGAYKSSDLGNSNYLQTKPKYVNEETPTRRAPENNVSDKLAIYPNPVTNNQFSVQFGKVNAGTYNLELTDIMGRVVMQQNLNIQTEGQVETISLQPSMARGVYLLKVIDQQKKSVLSQKLVVQ